MMYDGAYQPTAKFPADCKVRHGVPCPVAAMIPLSERAKSLKVELKLGFSTELTAGLFVQMHVHVCCASVKHL